MNNKQLNIPLSWNCAIFAIKDLGEENFLLSLQLYSLSRLETESVVTSGNYSVSDANAAGN